MSVISVPSLIKWTGSKRSQARAIVDLIPPHKTYIEPFLGSGSVLYLCAREGAVGGDIYAPLIELWSLVQSKPEDVIADYKEQWQKLQARLPDYFYETRDRFNAERRALDLNFLTRTCVNGIIRFNGKGEFNTSFHLSRPGMSPDRFGRIVKLWSSRIRGVRFVCQDYETTVNDATPGDFVYFDPPYAGNKQRYCSDLDIERLFNVLETLNRRGIKWALSFDGSRGDRNLVHQVPTDLYRRHLMLASGHSAVGKVLNRSIESVKESLYLNY